MWTKETKEKDDIDPLGATDTVAAYEEAMKEFATSAAQLAAWRFGGLSIKTNSPCPRVCPPCSSRTLTDIGPRSCAARSSAKRSWGTAKVIAMGRCWVITTNPVESAACTMLPASIKRAPTRPAMGALMVV